MRLFLHQAIFLLPCLCLVAASASASAAGAVALAGPGAADPLELLWSHGLQLAPDGSPLIAVRVEGSQASIELLPRGQAILRAGGRRIAAGPAGPLIATVRGGKPARLAYAAVVDELPFSDGAGVQKAVSRWKGRGFGDATSVVIGGAHALGGRSLDNRRHLILLAPAGQRDAAEKAMAAVARRFPEVSPRLHTQMVRRPSGTVEVRNGKGRLLASAPGVVGIDADAILVKQVEHSHGYGNHGREDRLYAGDFYLTVGADGKVAAVNLLPMEALLRGIVPSEIYASAPIEALKAQAVTARGEVLAKIGARHRSDPWAICAEQHCQVYKGLSGAHPRTDEAIEASHGEFLFSKEGKLVDSVFSSTCGGHTENNESVWGTPPDPSLRGVPDWVEGVEGQEALAFFAGRVSDVDAWLGIEVPGMCGIASLSRADKYRWVRRFSAEEMNEIGKTLGVGRVVDLSVTGRGVSGRATGLAFTGEAGARVVQGELKIRRLLGNLNSSLFVVEKAGQQGWQFRGAGWGHGVGMCQTGAIGRAERGHDYRAILRHYYNGAEPISLYWRKGAKSGE